MGKTRKNLPPPTIKRLFYSVLKNKSARAYFGNPNSLNTATKLRSVLALEPKQKILSEMADRQMSEERTSRRKTSGGQPSQVTQGQMSQRPSSRYKISRDPSSQGQTSQGQVNQRPMSQGQMSQGQMSQGQMSQGQMSQGKMSQSQMSQGQMSQGKKSQSQMSQGQMSQGQMSQGQMSQGQMSKAGKFSQGQSHPGGPGSGTGSEIYPNDQAQTEYGTSAPNFPSHEGPVIEATDTWWRVTFDCAGLDRRDVEGKTRRCFLILFFNFYQGFDWLHSSCHSLVANTRDFFSWHPAPLPHSFVNSYENLFRGLSHYSPRSLKLEPPAIILYLLWLGGGHRLSGH